MTFRASPGPILATLILVLAGCESKTPAEKAPAPAEHPAKVEAKAAPEEISTVAPPVEPSPVPSLPATPRGDLDKKDEGKPAEKMPEPPK